MEARAYAALSPGQWNRETRWELVGEYSRLESYILHSLRSSKTDIFKDLLSDPVDPSIRYGAYKMGMPRTLAIPVIARKNFPSDPNLASQVEELDPNCLKDETTTTKVDHVESGDAPKTITWRSRTVDLEDAAIATALGSVKSASVKLSEVLSSDTMKSPKDRGSAYDDILIASQDVVDATKHAIDELVSEGVGQSDKRMQSLLVTRTAVSYDMIGWRIGRNRVMVGQQDGILDYVQSFPSKKGSKKSSKDEPTGRKLAKLREKVVLYDAILQSVESIKELPGVAADSTLQEELGAKYSYFQALKCLTIARSHAVLSNPKSALALLSRATEKCTSANSQLSLSMDTMTTTSPPNLIVTPSESQNLLTYLQSELQRHRALVEIFNLTSTSSKPGNENTHQKPLVESLNEYPANGVVDLKNLVTYPPKMEVVPVKPLFFDAAWNYIDYPGRAVEKPIERTDVEEETKETESQPPQQQQQKKGWFGFGR
ncbi:hypothetical protein SS1G_01884 [Sclerotinia sclerotiorum 1980 UF-70]|uniref:Signal recognition particle subunit SRP68 n=1 Tax=Sclerotinia sclerotiorum (strain ATCC 18683 / 1980 / Ss-1) TaxID=665079 RepID=A7E9A4_SCLS1|nr:hypothetical protein SS1G_01884 [Sclerotinia sclerotiorum 1980 UF-70]EDN96956.1 hypothetical protein SS1G_01884 [Sclerotinia sclerotiorum 1980 UF-70]